MIMKSNRTYLILICILIFLTSHAQNNKANTWYFGGYAGLNFNSGIPVPLTDGAMNTGEGCATISDTDGSLLFYTDGITIWNNHHLIMENGFGLMGHSSATQSSIIVPKPGSDSLYYVFTVPVCNDPGDLYYSIVDISLNNGLGKVIVKNVFLYQPVTERVTAVDHANGTDVWVVTHLRDSDAFCSFLVSSAGVSTTPVISHIGAVHLSTTSYIGYLKISPEANYISVAIWGNLYLVEVFDFSDVTGQVTNAISISGYGRPYGIEYSPDESRLYFGANFDHQIIQIDLTAGTPNEIINSATEIYSNTDEKYGALQLGPDQKIYVTMEDKNYLGVINYPNALGTACDYSPSAVLLGGGTIGKLGLPTFIQSYFLANITYQNECFGDTTLFELSIIGDVQSVTWDFGDPASGSNNSSTIFNPTHLFTSPGSFTVTASMILNDGTSEVSTVEATIYDFPQVNLGNDTIICGSPNITLDAGPGFVSFLWNTGDTTQTIMASNSGTYHVMASTDHCSSFDTISINFQSSAVADAGSDEGACQFESFDFSNSSILPYASNFDSIRWTGGLGIFSDPGILYPVYSPGTNETGVVQLSLVVYGTPPCSNDTSSMVLTIQALPSLDAGIDDVICETENFTTSPTVDAYASVQWTSLGDGIFVNQNDLISEYIPGNGDVLTGNVSLILSVTPVAPCTSVVSDTLVIAIDRSPTSFAGFNSTFCLDGSFILDNSDTTNSGMLLWTNNGGDGTFDNSALLHPSYTPGANELLAGTITLSLIAYPQGACTETDTSDIVLEVQAVPVANAGGDATICEGETIVLDGNVSQNSSLLWSTLSGDGVFSSPTTELTEYIPGSLDIATGSVVLTLTAYPIFPCASPAVSGMTLNINANPLANAGSPTAIICEGASYTLSGSAQNFTAIQWTNNGGDGSFDNIAIPNATYTPGPNDIANGVVTLTPTPSCLPGCMYPTRSAPR